eukprot:357578-Chlamydomonas_euryale.AAC.3
MARQHEDEACKQEGSQAGGGQAEGSQAGGGQAGMRAPHRSLDRRNANGFSGKPRDPPLAGLCHCGFRAGAPVAGLTDLCLSPLCPADPPLARLCCRSLRAASAGSRWLRATSCSSATLTRRRPNRTTACRARPPEATAPRHCCRSASRTRCSASSAMAACSRSCGAADVGVVCLRGSGAGHERVQDRSHLLSGCV